MNRPPRIRGTIAIQKYTMVNNQKEKDGWTGVFKNDSMNPILFGQELWQELQANWSNLSFWGKQLLKYNYWDDFQNNGLCPYCGKIDLGQPNNIKAHVFRQLQDGVLTPDVDRIYHRHILRDTKVKSENGYIDGLFLEWLYIVDPETYSLEVFKAVRDEGIRLVISPTKQWEQPNYQYFPIGLYSLFSEEPDWASIENKGKRLSSVYWEKHQEAPEVKIN